MPSYLEELGLPSPTPKSSGLPGQVLSPLGGFRQTRQQTIDRPEMSPEEAKKAGQLLANQGVWTDLVEGTGSVLDNITMAFDSGVDWLMEKTGVGAPGVKGDIVKQAEKDIARRKAEEKLWNKVATGPLRGGMYSVPEIATYVVPTWRLGVTGKGLSAIPKTAVNWGAADYTIARALNKSHEEALQEGAIAALFGLPFGGYRAYKTIQRGSLGGGTGVPPEVELAMEPTKKGLEGVVQDRARKVMELRQMKDRLQGKPLPAVDEDLLDGGFAKGDDLIYQLQQTIDKSIGIDEIDSVKKAQETIKRLQEDDRYLRNKIINEMMEDAGIPYKAADDMEGSFAAGEGAPIMDEAKGPSRVGVQKQFRQAADEIMKNPEMREFYRQEMIDSVLRRSKLKEGDEYYQPTISDRKMELRQYDRDGIRYNDPEASIDLAQNPGARAAMRDAYAERARVEPRGRPIEPRMKLPETKRPKPEQVQQGIEQRKAMDAEYAKVIRENTPASGQRTPAQQRAIMEARDRIYGKPSGVPQKTKPVPTDYDDATLARMKYSDLPTEAREYITKAEFERARKKAETNLHKARQMEADAQRILKEDIKVDTSDLKLKSNPARLGPDAAGMAKVKQALDAKKTKSPAKGFRPTVKARPDAKKAPYKAGKATAYIGYGKEGSSTAQYLKDAQRAGIPTNKGKYKENDVVFASINGTPTREAAKNTLAEIIRALEDGATVLTDSAEYLSKSSYNKGEKWIAEQLKKRGYSYKTDPSNPEVGIWTKSKSDILPAVDEFGNHILDPRKKYKVDLDRLTKRERTQFEKYQAMMKDGQKLTKAQSKAYVRLMEKMQEPRQATRAEEIKRVNEKMHGDSEDELKKANKRIFEKDFDSDVKKLSDDDIDELDRMAKEEEARKQKLDIEPDLNKSQVKEVRDFRDVFKKGDYDKSLEGIAKALADKLGNVKVIVTDQTLMQNGMVLRGFYNPKTGNVVIGSKYLKETPEAVVHEMVHAATHKAIHTNKKLLKELESSLDEFLQLNPQFKNQPFTANVDEWLAWGLTDSNVISYLKRKPSGGGSLWQKIKNVVAEMLGMKPFTTEYDRLMRVFEESVNPGMSKSTRTAWDKFAENMAKELNPAIESLKAIKDTDWKDVWKQTKANWTAPISNTEAAKQYRELHGRTRNALNQAAKARGFFVKTIEKSLKKLDQKPGGSFDRQFHESVLRTDYAAIREFGSKKEALRFIKENIALFESAKDMIDVLAKSMKDKRFMNNTKWRPNGRAIAEELTDRKLPKGMSKREAGHIIDKMVSIRSLTNSDWAFISKYRDHETFQEMLNMSDILRAQSHSLFPVDPLNRIKGYVAEEYDGIYEYIFSKDKNKWEKVFRVDQGHVQGAVPMNIGSGVMGETWFPKEAFKDFLNMSDEEIDQIFKQKGSHNKVQSLLMDIASTHNLGFILDNGRITGVRKVAGEAQRLSMGKVISATRVMGLTYENGIRKILTRDNVISHILEEVRTGKSQLFKGYGNSTKDMEPPPGYSALTKKEREALPKQLRNTVVFVKTEMKDMLLGFEKANLFRPNMLGAMEQVLKDTVHHFKLNVVMKNPASWLNNAMFGMFLNMQNGVNPAKHVRYFREGLKYQREADRIMQRMVDLVAKGREGTSEYKALQIRLEKNPYYAMDRRGLAVTVMTNILDTPSGSRMFTDKVLSKWVDSFFGKETGEKIKKVFTNIHLDPKSKAGQYAMNIFGAIDSQSRFALAYDRLLKSGWKPGQPIKSEALRKAVDESNALYGDLDMVTTRWSHALQTYGVIPFSNWFFRASAGLYKSVKDHPVAATAIGLGLYGVQEWTEKRTASWNPLATLVETPLDMATMSPYGEPTRFMRAAAEPAVYRKMFNAIKYDDPMSVIITENF